MRAVITVIGKDKVGIIARISNILADSDVNILDISQTIMQELFTMVMLVDMSGAKCTNADIIAQLDKMGADMDLSIRFQDEEIFNSMHRV